MITRIRADGFRSLDKFELDVRPGVNVLVGPNGGGKTNILALFSFLSALASSEIGDVISGAGGVSKVFKKLADGVFRKTISVGVEGSFDFEKNTMYVSPGYRSRLNDNNVTGILYEWECEIDASAGYDQTIFSRQTLRIKVIQKNDTNKNEDRTYDFEVSSKAVSGGIAVSEVCHDPARSFLIHQSEGDEDGHFFQLSDRQSGKVGTSPIFHLYNNAEILRWLGFSLQGGITYNFDPSACKKSNDSAKSPMLERDGEGLAAVVYAIERSHSILGQDLFHFPSRIDKVTFQILQRYFGLINPSITGIFAKNNPFDNNIVVFIRVAGEGDNDVDFPLEFASDGTVKWLAFTVALLSHKVGFSIEEPENFLHPEMQRHAVELVRAELGDNAGAFVMMTTHSESLLNASSPEEVIVVSMDEGKTRARRISDPYLLSEEIRETGFGLGYYYISGAIDE